MNRIDTYMSGLPFTDHVYENKQVVRIDSSAAQVSELLQHYGVTTTENIIWGGLTKPYGIYTNPTLSYYKAGTAPFGNNTWYGVKKDLETGVLTYKVEDPSYNGTAASKASHYSSNGIILSYDLYYYWTVEQATEFCTENNVPYPATPFVEPRVWIWGVSYSLQNTIIAVKAYVEVK